MCWSLGLTEHFILSYWLRIGKYAEWRKRAELVCGLQHFNGLSSVMQNGFLNAFPPGCGCISGPYERHSSPNQMPRWGHLSSPKIPSWVQKEPGQAAWTGQRLVANTGTPLVATLLCVISTVRLGTQQPAAEILCTIYPCWMELGLQPVPGVTPRKANLFFLSLVRLCSGRRGNIWKTWE